eukprot:Skav219173  [mRNA]  locus=scaffold648:375799:376623:- [translate_table: standard]
MAVADEGQPVHAYLVLTLWPRMQKPKPATVQVPLKGVLSFRAVRLISTGEDQILTATTHVDMLEAANVLAILDSEVSDIDMGKVTLSADSSALLRCMQSDEYVVQKGAQPRRRRLAKVNGKVKKMMKEKAKKNGKAKQPAKSDASCAFDGANDIVATDLRRSAAGRRSIALVLKRFRVQDSMNFSDAPVFDQRTDSCTLQGLDGVKWKPFLEKAVRFFESKHAFAARSPVAYGERVFSDLVQINKGFIAKPPSRTHWVQFVHQVAKVMDVATTL